MMGNPVADYVDATARRLVADGCEVHTEEWGGATVVVGYRSDFRLRWMATKLHLFTIVMAHPSVTPGVTDRFTKDAMDYGLGRKGQLRGFQSGVAVLPCLVSGWVAPSEIDWAASTQRLRFACFARPVVVDTSRGVVGYFRGNTAVGRVYSAHLRRKLDAYFPPPGPGAGPDAGLDPGAALGQPT